MSTMNERISKCLKKSGLTKTAFGERIGVSQSFVSQMCSGASSPRTGTIKNICREFNVNEEWLRTGEGEPFVELPKNEALAAQIQEFLQGGTDSFRERLVSLLLRLTPEQWDALEGYARELTAQAAPSAPADAALQAQQKQPEPDKVVYITKWFPVPMSAGTGQPAGDDKAEELELTKRPPHGTSYIAPVSGSSMEPTYHDGDKLFVRACTEIEPGQIGVFYMDGQQWVKELGDDVLISHNSDYTPIPMRDDIECQGLVLGVCDDSYFE